MASNPISFFTRRRQEDLGNDDAEAKPGQSPYNFEERMSFIVGAKHDAERQRIQNQNKGKNTRGGKANAVGTGGGGGGGGGTTKKKTNNKHKSISVRNVSEGASVGGKRNKAARNQSKFLAHTNSDLSERENDLNRSGSINGDFDRSSNQVGSSNFSKDGIINIYGILMKDYLKRPEFKTGPHNKMKYTNLDGETVSFSIDKSTNRGVYIATIALTETQELISLPIVPLCVPFGDSLSMLGTECCYHINWQGKELVKIEDLNNKARDYFASGGYAMSGDQFNPSNDFQSVSIDRDVSSSYESDSPIGSPLLMRSLSLELGPLKYIDISHNHLIEVPIWLFYLPRVQRINVSHNHLESLPSVQDFPATDEKKFAPRLKTFNIAFNKFKTIPPLLRKFIGVEELDLSGLGDAISNDEWNRFSLGSSCMAIHSLCLRHNHLASIPSFCLKELTCLKHLNLSDNLLNGLPYEMCLLSGLVTLDLSCNKLRSLENINQNTHSKLTSLKASRNEISDVSLLLLALPALTLLDVSSNVIQSFSDLEVLPLDCLDAKEKKPHWCDAASRSKLAEKRLRRISVIVEDNLPDMNPPPSAFASSATLKMFLNELRTVSPFLEQYRKHGEQLEVSKQALRNIGRLKDSCCGALAHAVFGECNSLATSLEGVRFYFATPQSVSMFKSLSHKDAPVTISSRVVAVHKNGSIDIEVADRVLSGWLGSQHCVVRRPNCGESFHLSDFVRSTSVVPPPSALLRTPSTLEESSSEEEKEAGSPRSRKARRKVNTSAKKRNKQTRSSDTWRDVFVELIGGSNTATVTVQIPSDREESASGVRDALATSAAKQFKFDSFDPTSVVFRLVENMKILETDDDLVDALSYQLESKVLANTSTRSPPKPSTPIESPEFQFVKNKKNRKGKKNVRVPDLSHLTVPGEERADGRAEISSLVHSPTPTRSNTRPVRSPPPPQPKPLKVMVWMERPREVTVREVHIGAQDVANTLVQLCDRCLSSAHQLLHDASSNLDPDIELLAFFAAPAVDRDGVSALRQLPTQRELKVLLTEVTSSVVVPAARFPKDVTDFLGDYQSPDRLKIGDVPKKKYAPRPGSRTYSPRWIQFSGHGRDIKSNERPKRPEIFKDLVDGDQGDRDTYVSFACPLVFEEGDPNGEEFISVLKHCSRLEGVFLNACHTYKFGLEIEKALPYVAVVAWEGSPSDHEAYIWAKHFYHQLGKQYGRSFEEAYHAALETYRIFWSGTRAKEALREVREALNNRNFELLLPKLVRRQASTIPSSISSHPPPPPPPPPRISAPKPVQGNLGALLARSNMRSQSAPVGAKPQGSYRNNMI